MPRRDGLSSQNIPGLSAPGSRARHGGRSRADAIRAIAAELERVANHTGDLGALAGDVGFLPTMSYCGRIRGDVLNMTAVLCGNRFGRGLVRPGGVGYDLDDALIKTLLSRLNAVEKDVTGAHIRWLEIKASMDFIRRQLPVLPEGPVVGTAAPIGGDMLAVSLVGGWRGEICHVAATDAGGLFRLYKVVDPSFYNWFGLSLALRNQQISDFPLCNKSFNLSYCGHDLF